MQGNDGWASGDAYETRLRLVLYVASWIPSRCVARPDTKDASAERWRWRHSPNARHVGRARRFISTSASGRFC
jgi:hypothetical protein